MSFRKVISKNFFIRGFLVLAASKSRQGKSDDSEPALNGDTNSCQLTAIDCIKQACLHSVNSSSILLTTTVHAIVDSSNKYKEALSVLIASLDESSLDNDWGTEIWDHVIELRLEVTKCRNEYNRLLMYMGNVEKVVEATVEAAFNANADYICKTLCERSHSAAVEVNKCKSEVEDLEKLYLSAQVNAAKLEKKKGDEEKLQENITD